MNSGIEVRRTQSMKKMDRLLREILHESWKHYLRSHLQFLKKRSPESVHELRRSIRTIEATLELCQVPHACKSGDQLYRRFNEELKALSALRDTQVQIETLRIHPPAWLRRQPFLKHLKTREKKQLKKSVRVIKSLSQRTMGKRFARFEEGLFAFLNDLNSARQSELKNELKQYLHARQSEIEFKSFALAVDDGRAFHKLRIKIKSFAKQLEMLEPIVRAEAGFKQKLAKTKLELGELQDRTALETNLRHLNENTKDRQAAERHLKNEILLRRKRFVIEAYGTHVPR